MEIKRAFVIFSPHFLGNCHSELSVTFASVVAVAFAFASVVAVAFAFAVAFAADNWWVSSSAQTLDDPSSCWWLVPPFVAAVLSRWALPHP